MAPCVGGRRGYGGAGCITGEAALIMPVPTSPARPTKGRSAKLQLLR